MDYKKNLTSQQFLALSWLAYYVNNHIEKGAAFESVNVAKCYCSNVLNIPSNFIFSVVIINHFTGLQNMNRLSEIAYWE
jgi:hypothetical protein